MDLRRFAQYLWIAWLVPATAVTILGTVFDARDAVALGMPAHLWQIIGILMFAVTIAALLARRQSGVLLATQGNGDKGKVRVEVNLFNQLTQSVSTNAPRGSLQEHAMELSGTLFIFVSEMRIPVQDHLPFQERARLLQDAGDRLRNEYNRRFRVDVADTLMRLDREGVLSDRDMLRVAENPTNLLMVERLAHEIGQAALALDKN